MVNQKQFLLDLAKAKMPFGKYKNSFLVDIPEYYYVWYKQKGFPKGKLGLQMESMYELKMNGLDNIVKKLQNYTTN